MLRSAVLVLTAGLILTGCGSEPVAQPPDPSATTMADQPENPVVTENQKPGDSSWQKAVRRADDPAGMSGYADHSAVDPGDPVELFVSTSADEFTVTAYRMGWYGGAKARKVWTSQPQKGRQQTAQGYVQSTMTPYAEWERSLTVDTADWLPGMYLLRLAGDQGSESLIPLVVRAPDARGRIVLLMSDLTWQAYNNWGGRSAYAGPGGFADRSRSVSFSRPYANGSGTGKYLGYEHPVVVLAERLGIPVSYVVTSDLADGDSAPLEGAEGIVSLGHNEYWTGPERAAVTKARDAGTDLGFLGANTMYWRVRLEQGPQGLPQEVVYKSADEDPESGPQTTARFRDEPHAQAERSLVGLDYECFPATGQYTITDRDFFLFRGTDTNRTYPGLVDIEVDRAYPLPGTPRNLQIVANSPTDCNGVTTVSNSGYYSTGSGAGVFAVGTMGWVLHALRAGAPEPTRRFAEKVTGNLLLEMMRGRMGEAHPARPNLSRFDLPKTNTTGAA